MPYPVKCVNCKHIWTPQGRNDDWKCPKCGSEKWGKVDSEGNYTQQGESFNSWTSHLITR